jgi:hypothetical protein
VTDEQFWPIIDAARQATGLSATSLTAHPLKLRNILSSLDDDELQDFCKTFYEKLCDLNKWDLWAAGYIIAGGMSDDSFHYFRSWVIGKGEQTFNAAMNNPASLDDFIAQGTSGDQLENEQLEYMGLELLERRGIRFDPRESVGRFADDEPEGTPFDEDEVMAKFPKLAARFG